MRLIDADALIYEIRCVLWDWETVDGITSKTVLKQTITDIKNQPTIDAIPARRGKWEMITPNAARCSVCKSIESTNGLDKTMKGHIFRAVKKFCPNCGARMDGEI